MDLQFDMEYDEPKTVTPHAFLCSVIDTLTVEIVADGTPTDPNIYHFRGHLAPKALETISSYVGDWMCCTIPRDRICGQKVVLCENFRLIRKNLDNRVLVVYIGPIELVPHTYLNKITTVKWKIEAQIQLLQSLVTYPFKLIQAKPAANLIGAIQMSLGRLGFKRYPGPNTVEVKPNLSELKLCIAQQLGCKFREDAFVCSSKQFRKVLNTLQIESSDDDHVVLHMSREEENE